MTHKYWCGWFGLASLVAVILSTVSASSTPEGKNDMELVPIWGLNSWRKLHHDPGASVLGNIESSSGTEEVTGDLPHFGRGRELAGETGSCPMSFDGLSKLRFAITDTCSKSPPIPTNNTWPPVGRDHCCNVALTAFAIVAAGWSESSDFFRVKNEATLRTCVSDMVSIIKDYRNGLDVGICFSESFFRYSNRNPSLCGPKTFEEYESVVGLATLSSLRKVCEGNLLDSQVCSVCSGQAQTVFVKIAGSAIANNVTLPTPDADVSDLDSAKTYDCIYLTVTYIATVLQPAGPYDAGSQKCLYVMPLAPPTSDSHHLGLALGVTAAVLVVFLGALCMSLIWWRKRRGLSGGWMRASTNSRKSYSGLLPGQRGGVVLFNYEDIQTATDNFSPKNHIGSGGFGSVYKGVMADGTILAVKRLKNCSSEGEAEFVNEVEVINRVRHRNLVRLRGCCVVAGTLDEGHQRLLIYDFLPGGSLHDHLFASAVLGKKTGGLTWAERSRIAVDIARGLAYLHNDTQPPIFHRDIKASNVLLDKDLNACLADFGLARLTLEGQSHMTASTVAGTHGYMAPEYAMYGKLTGKSDVYSFGVVLLEIMSGRKALDSSQIATPRFLISDWCWTVLESEGSVTGVIDQRMRENANSQLLSMQERFVITGMLCSHSHDAMRPTMADALKYLEGDLPVPKLPSTPAPLYAETSTFKKYMGDSTTGSSAATTTTGGSYSAILSINVAEPR